MGRRRVEDLTVKQMDVTNEACKVCGEVGRLYVLFACGGYTVAECGHCHRQTKFFPGTMPEALDENVDFTYDANSREEDAMSTPKKGEVGKAAAKAAAKPAARARRPRNTIVVTVTNGELAVALKSNPKKTRMRAKAAKFNERGFTNQFCNTFVEKHVGPRSKVGNVAGGLSVKIRATLGLRKKRKAAKK